MGKVNRISGNCTNLPSLEDMCQFLVWSPKELRELQNILRNAPVTFGEKISSEDMISLAYLSTPSYLLAVVSDELKNSENEGVKLCDRDFHRAVEIHVDTAENIPRDYETAIECDWTVNNFGGRSVIGRNQLEFMLNKVRNIEIYEQKETGQILIAYNQDGKDYLLSFELYNQEIFHFPWTYKLSEE